ncbi:MAG: NAD(P)-dependent alcohol dehydrogenase [Chloroflexi bacterium AL-W]|nr:NAD(P)-dependent alcohol dehydrogenase [Chloroflexi bacterium AL-N1]NOK69049.1 NAD(P)-dependent alcohol dehydrogenase [Chloroflexi bacterium AL-N10]NOK77032.1 NAD(P)-dependent alcohol dehydrogenase [Chloroflexi bacterium AL-N5]NOK83677.1 NAD(P)-dependent alcohol dehydrogenase [Chloroflexi bacterium AL-W]NOK90887.1 NAD(P)-dependent alcohol dehydrogenase [Chloroflexi bacterium AL-N15]
MKAIVFTHYGPLDVLQFKKVAKPTPRNKEVLIRIHATTVTAVECTFRRGVPFLSKLFTGLTKPKITIFGEEVAGEIKDRSGARPAAPTPTG